MMPRPVTDVVPPGPPALPHEGECVVCFVDRMTRAYGCSGRLLWAALWRDRCAPRATALEKRLERKHGYCDCEVLMNVFVPREEAGAGGHGIYDDGILDDEDEAQPEAKAEPEPCLGVRKGSSQPCKLWVGARYRRC